MKNYATGKFSINVVILTLTVLCGQAQGQNPYTSSYLYLSIEETTPLGDVIKFWHEDTLYGPVHSNDTIAIMENPVFYDTISTSAATFWQGIGYNPQFSFDPIFNAPRVALPTGAAEVREAAAVQGLFFDSEEGYWAHRLQFMDSQGWRMYRWPIGTPFDSTIIAVGPPMQEGAIFVSGYLELKGVFRGVGAVGAMGYPASPDSTADLGKHCIRLLDDVRYWFADPITGAYNDTTGGYEDMLTIISESNITIANTWENGRENQSGSPPDNKDIIITAALVALGDESKHNYWGSFSFEEQNEADGGTTLDPTIWEWYNGSYECPVPPNSDERGDIHLWGAVAERRRGYVHRSNHGGTGYGKDYHHDQRFRTQAPPYGILARHIPYLYPTEVDFGEVQTYTTDTINVTLVNLGGTYIDVDSAYTSGSLALSIAPYDSNTIVPGDSAILIVRFRPIAVGLYQDTLKIDLYYGEGFEVPLSGSGAELGIEFGDAIPEKHDLSIYPNPFNNQLQITFGQFNRPVDLTIYDISGRIVKKVNSMQLGGQQNSFSWQPENLSGGIYIISLETSGSTHLEKVVYLK